MASGGKSAKNLAGRSPGGGEDSSESDGETEPAKSFHRRLSTNRDIKCSVCPLAVLPEKIQKLCFLPIEQRQSMICLFLTGSWEAWWRPASGLVPISRFATPDAAVLSPFYRTTVP